MRPARRHPQPPADLEILLHYLPHVVRSPDLSDWERSFAVSILARHRRGPFVPSDRQLPILRRLVERFRADQMGRLHE